MIRQVRVSTIIIGVLASLLAPCYTVAQERSNAASIAEQAMPGVVVIHGMNDQGEVSGSGFLISNNGTIITCLHVIEEMRSGAIQLSDGDIYNAFTIRAYDERRDIAIIQIAGFDLPHLELGNSNDVTPGEMVIVIGNPLGMEKTITTGVVSALRNYEGIGKVIQTDAAANPGNSGGPVLNMEGEVIGIVNFKLRGSENLNFAIPINYARGLLETMGKEMALSDLGKVRSSPGEMFGAAGRKGLGRTVLPGKNIQYLGEIETLYVDDLGDERIREKLIVRLARDRMIRIVDSPVGADAVLTGYASTTQTAFGGWDADLVVRVVNYKNDILWAGDAKPRGGSASGSVANQISKNLQKAVKKDRERRGRN